MVNFSLTLKCPSGEEQTFSVTVSELRSGVKEVKAPPYRMPKLTASHEPQLIESTSFVEIG